MTWQLLTAISVAGLSLSIVLQRVLLSRDKTNPFAYAVVFQGLVGVLTAIAAIATASGWPDLHGLWLPAIACVVLCAIGHITYAKALQRLEASVFSVLFATQAVWITGLGIVVLHESLGVLQIVGVVLLAISVGLLIKHPRGLRLDKGTALGLLTGLCFGLGLTAWGYVGRHTDATLSWSALTFIVPALLVWAIHPRASRHMRPLLTPRTAFRLATLAVLYAIACAALIFAYKYGEFSIVSSLRQSGVVVTVLLALLFLRQERTIIARKLLSAAICAAGVICLLI